MNTPLRPAPALYAALSVLLLSLGACAPAQMPVDGPLAATTPLRVEGRQGWKIHERVRFGAYDTGPIDRSWTGGPSLNVMGVYQSDRRSQTYAFTLHEQGRPVGDVDCEARLRQRTLRGSTDISLRDRSALTCELVARGPDPARWRMRLDERGDRPLTGVLYHDASTLHIEGTRRLRRGLPLDDDTGYTFTVEGAAVGAVEVVSDGRVWIGGDLPAAQRRVVAAAAAALLVLEDLRGHLEQVPS